MGPTLAELGIPASLQGASTVRRLDDTTYEANLDPAFCVRAGMNHPLPALTPARVGNQIDPQSSVHRTNDVHIRGETDPWTTPRLTQADCIDEQSPTAAMSPPSSSKSPRRT